ECIGNFDDGVAGEALIAVGAVHHECERCAVFRLNRFGDPDASRPGFGATVHGGAAGVLGQRIFDAVQGEAMENDVGVAPDIGVGPVVGRFKAAEVGKAHGDVADFAVAVGYTDGGDGAAVVEHGDAGALVVEEGEGIDQIGRGRVGKE